MSAPEASAGTPWHQIYRSPALEARRRSKHIRKLKSVGLLSPGAGGRLLDVCSGEGEMLDILSSGPFDLLTGIDLPAVHRKGRWHYASALAQQLPFRDNVFDWILCAHALHHLQGTQHIRAFLDEARRCLKPGGKLALIDHYDSMHLRAVFALLRSNLARLTPWSAAFRQQLLAEHAELYEYLDHWTDTKRLLSEGRFVNPFYRQDLFFFYFVAEKADA